MSSWSDRAGRNWPYFLGLVFLGVAVFIFAPIVVGGDEETDEPRTGTFAPRVASIDGIVETTARCSADGFATELTLLVDEPTAVRVSVQFLAPTRELMHRVDANRVELTFGEPTVLTLPYDETNVAESLRGFTPECVPTYERIVG